MSRETNELDTREEDKARTEGRLAEWEYEEQQKRKQLKEEEADV